MSKSDNHSHQEEKTDPSAIKKQSVMEELETGLSKLRVEDRSDIRVKFLINVPVGVTPEMSENAESHCQKFLDLLRRRAFGKEDEFRYKDIAVVFGLNGNESVSQAVETEFQKEINSDIAFAKFWFPWSETNGIPFQRIRETIKKHEQTKQSVRHLRDKDTNVKIYFCFFDADTIDFNHVLSSYIDIIKEDQYPTVMSTGFLHPENSEFTIKRERDRHVRIITAEHFPLGTYYPEPNFCVLLPDGHDTLPESFINTEFKQMNMESPVLIRQVKERKGFSAVFADKNAIITHNLKHFHTRPWTWATSAYTHKEFKVTEIYLREHSEEHDDKRMGNGLQRSLLMALLKSDEEAQRIEAENPFEGRGAGQVFRAAEAVRQYLQPEELDEQDEPEEQEEPDELEKPEEPEA